MDIGNTNLVLGIVKEKRIIEIFRFATNVSLTEDEYFVKFNSILKHCSLAEKEIDDVIISSVVPQMDVIMTNTFKKYYGLMPIFVEPGLKSGIHIKIENPKQLGADLLIGAVGSYYKYRDNIIIVDIGTATKLFVVTKDGEFLGGAIAPGVITSLNSLVSSTAKLQHTSIQKPNGVIGRDTASSIQSGIIYGTAALIDGMINRIESEIGPTKVVLTGGLANIFNEVILTPHHYEPNILLEGLIILYYKNKK